MKKTYLKRIEKFPIYPQDISTLLSSKDCIVETVLDLFEVIAPINEEESEYVIAYLTTNYTNEQERIHEIIETIIPVFERRDTLYLTEFMHLFFIPSIESIVLQEVGLDVYKKWIPKLLKTPQFIENVKKNPDYFSTILTQISLSFFSLSLLKDEEKGNHRLSMISDPKLIQEGSKIHLLALDLYHDFSKKSEYWANVQNKEQYSTFLKFIKRMSSNVTLLKKVGGRIGFFMTLVASYDPVFMDNWCFNEIICNEEVLTNRSVEEMVQLAKWYAKYKKEEMTEIKTILTHPVLLKLPYEYQVSLIEDYKKMRMQDFKDYIKVISFALEELNENEEGLKNILMTIPENLTISTFIRQGWKMDKIQQVLDECDIEEIDIGASIKELLYRKEK